MPIHFFGNTDDWRVGFFEGAIPQLPLTTLNSVVSVCALRTALYPNKATKVLVPVQPQSNKCPKWSSMIELLSRNSQPGVLTRREVALVLD